MVLPAYGSGHECLLSKTPDSPLSKASTLTYTKIKLSPICLTTFLKYSLDCILLSRYMRNPTLSWASLAQFEKSSRHFFSKFEIS